MLCITPQSEDNSPTTRDQNLLIPPVPRAQIPPGLLQSVSWAMSSCQGAQDWQHRLRDLLSTPWRPSSDVAEYWALAPPQECLKTRTKVDTNNSGYTTLLMGSLHKTEPSCTAWPCSHPATLRLLHGHKHCFGLHSKVFREPCIFHQLRKGWRLHWASRKGLLQIKCLYELWTPFCIFLSF